MLWRPSRPIRTCSRPPGFIQPCQPALADRPPAGPGWLNEIKFDGYRVIARKDGERVRLWARTTSDYSSAFMRIRDAVAALPVRSRRRGRPHAAGQHVRLRGPALEAGAGRGHLVAYDVMEVDGRDVRPEPLEVRKKRLARLLSRSNKIMRDGIQLSEALTGDGGAIFRHACGLGLEGIVSKRVGSRYVSGRTKAWLKTKNPDFERR